MLLDGFKPIHRAVSIVRAHAGLEYCGLQLRNHSECKFVALCLVLSRCSTCVDLVFMLEERKLRVTSAVRGKFLVNGVKRRLVCWDRIHLRFAERSSVKVRAGRGHCRDLRHVICRRLKGPRIRDPI